MKNLGWLIALATVINAGESFAQDLSGPDSAPGTETLYIPTDLPPTEEAEAPLHPFFAAEDPASEVWDKVQELEKRVQALEKKNGEEISLNSKKGVSIQSKGSDLVIQAPGEVVVDSKTVVLPRDKK